MNSSIKFKEVKIIQILLMYIITIFILIGLGLILNSLKICDIDSFLEDNLLALGTNIILFIMLIYSFRVTINNFKFLYKDFKNKVDIKEVLSVVFTQICFSMGTVFLLLAIVYLINPNIFNELLNESAEEILSVKDLVISMLFSVISAPIVEELIFRAIIFKRLSKKFSIWTSMIVSSLIFGMLHTNLSIIGAIVFGIANCILYLKYKNILIPMLVHFLNNLIVSLPSIISHPYSNNKDIMNLTLNDIIIYFIIGAILFIIGCLIFIRFINKNKAYLKKYTNRIQNVSKYLRF
ncbi:CPBP family intramembrane metalloprotease [Romboutsia maritimum]|uniref:CPBP family intramembrane metalloprotease n=1 Tax=Romboutsia maritimum TaxID=2020948 RepID=A0A371IR76_9FIRM|nr:type II CAAX endopeptidase family protein [Romboutsia maritimum]RDY22973.1 CPBP family intramembrane metalloprotease [Romboutsia maritimum]